MHAQKNNNIFGREIARFMFTCVPYTIDSMVKRARNIYFEVSCSPSCLATSFPPSGEKCSGLARYLNLLLLSCQNQPDNFDEILQVSAQLAKYLKEKC